MPEPNSLAAKLHRLRDKFIEGLPQRIESIANALARLGDDPDEHAGVTRQFHSLAGTAGTHGLSAIAALAADGEEACESFDDETIPYLLSILDSMRAVVAVTHESGRILCVEDDGDHANFITAILEHAGFETRTIADPAGFDFALATFRPDLILMDIVLPGITGVELARSIRSDNAYATVPIIFLTNRHRVESRIEAVGAGGDDYLTKPVSPELLLSVVSARLKASRAMQVLIDHDGLTGVLTHAAFMRRAQNEMTLAQRNGDELALVMLDLDYFKGINDSHGHLAGDEVLSKFASFLARNVRAGDEVGRYGGEEFALLLRNISQQDVQRLVNRLLEDFSAIAFRGSRGARFHVTFSAGVAMFGSGRNLQEWKQSADDALYSAKHHGRARVEAA